MKTNRNFCIVALCAMLIAAVGCNSSDETSSKINIISVEEPEVDHTPHISKVWGYDTLNYNIQILEHNRQIYLKAHPRPYDVSAQYYVEMDEKCNSVDSANQVMHEVYAHADSCWQQMMDLCELGHFETAFDYYNRNETDIIVAMPNSTCMYTLHALVAGPLLEKCVSKEEYNKRMLDWLSFDKMMADEAMSFKPGKYVPDHYEDLVIDLIFCSICNEEEKDDVLALVDDISAAREINSDGDEDFDLLDIYKLEYNIYFAYSDLFGMQSVRNVIFKYYLDYVTDAGMEIDAGMEKRINKCIDDLLDIAEPVEEKTYETRGV